MKRNTREFLYYRALYKAREFFGYRRYTKNVHRLHKAIVGEVSFLTAMKQIRIKPDSRRFRAAHQMIRDYQEAYEKLAD